MGMASARYVIASPLRCISTLHVPVPSEARAAAAPRRAAKRSASWRFVPRAPSWDPRALLPATSAAARVSDADMTRLEALSNLRLRREGGVRSEYERARRDVAAVLSAAGALAGLAAGAREPLLAAALRALPDDALEAAAEARWARLREDAVTEGGDAEALLSHAAAREGAFFVAPRFAGVAKGHAPLADAVGGCTECGKKEPLDACSACGAAFCDEHDTDALVFPIDHAEGCSGDDGCACHEERGELPPLCHACADEAGV